MAERRTGEISIGQVSQRCSCEAKFSSNMFHVCRKWKCWKSSFRLLGRPSCFWILSVANQSLCHRSKELFAISGQVSDCKLTIFHTQLRQHSRIIFWLDWSCRDRDEEMYFQTGAMTIYSEAKCKVIVRKNQRIYHEAEKGKKH